MSNNSIRTNYLYNLAFRIMAVILPFITAPYISRVLGAENIGIYSYCSSLMSFFLMFASLGILDYGAREIARRRDEKTGRCMVFWELVLFKLVTVVFSLVPFFTYIRFCENAYIKYYQILSIEFITSLLDLSWYYSGMEMFRQLSIRNAFVKIVGTLSIFVFVKDEQALSAYILCIVLPNLIGNILLWKKAIESVGFVSIKKLHVHRHIKEIFIFFIPAISVQIYHTVDKLMLQWVLHDNYQNGYYDQAYKIITILLTILTSYNSVMYSRMSNLYKHKNFDAVNSYIKQSISFIEMIGVPMAVGLFIIAPRFVPVFFGAGYAEVVKLLRIFSPMIVVTGLSNMIATQCLIPAGKQGKSNVAIVAGAVTNVILNGLLIPSFGSMGACTATIISEVVILALMSYYQKDIIRPILEQSWNYVLASIVMAGTIELLHLILPYSSKLAMNAAVMVLLVFAGVLAYLGILFLRRDSTLISFTKNIVKR